MYVIISVINAVLPLLLILLLWRFLTGVFKGSKNPAQTKLPQNESQEIPDLAAEFERKLKQKKQAGADVVTDSSLKVYSESQPVEVRSEPASVQLAAVPVQEKQQVKVYFSHQALVNGVIMSEILNKPRSIEPYEGRF